MEEKHRKVMYACVECDDFEFEKTYTGLDGTRGEAAFEESGGFEECPVCGGAVTTSVL